LYIERAKCTNLTYINLKYVGKADEN
jgi:hypothetical protein